MKLFFLAEILAPNDFCYLSFQAMGKRKLQKYSYEYLKLGKINSPDMLQFHLVPTGKMMPIHLSKELLGWRLLVLVSCWLEGEGDNVQETSILEGFYFELWDLDLLAALSSSTNSFLLALVGSVLNQIRLCLPLPVLPLPKVTTQWEVWAKGDLRGSNSMHRWFLRRPFTLFALVCKAFTPHLTPFLTETILCLILTAQVKVSVGSVKTICMF